MRLMGSLAATLALAAALTASARADGWYNIYHMYVNTADLPGESCEFHSGNQGSRVVVICHARSTFQRSPSVALFRDGRFTDKICSIYSNSKTYPELATSGCFIVRHGNTYEVFPYWWNFEDPSKPMRGQ